MPTITPLPDLLNEVRNLKKKITSLRNEDLCLCGAWLEQYYPSTACKDKRYWRVRSRQETLPNGKRLLHITRADEIETYRKAIARGRRIMEWQRRIRDTQRRINALVARAEKRGIVVRNVLGDPDATPEWYTPPPYIEMVRSVLGTIDLDPASNDVAQTWIQAGTYYTKEQDGLIQPWFSRVYCNPPYGSPEVRLMAQRFLEKAIACYQDGDIEVAILLLNRSEAQWYKELSAQVTAICEVTRRINFIDENGIPQKSPRYYSDFLYLGGEPERFQEVFSAVGTVQIINKNSIKNYCYSFMF
jgi:hypothetical protein